MDLDTLYKLKSEVIIEKESPDWDHKLNPLTREQLNDIIAWLEGKIEQEELRA